MNFKKYLILIIITISFSANAQKRGFFSRFENLQTFDQKTFSFGYSIGIVQYDFKTDFKVPYEHLEVKGRQGFTVGILGNYNFNKNISFRFEPNIAFGSRELTFKNLINDSERNREVKSTYLNFPVFIKFKANRHINMRPYLAGGAGFAYNLSANEKNPDDNSRNVFRMFEKTYFYEIAFGVEFYTGFFKVTPSIHGVFNLKNEVIPDKDVNSPWTSNIYKMSTRAVFFKLVFE